MTNEITNVNKNNLDENEESVLKVEGLSTHYIDDGKTVKAVDDVSFELDQGQTLGLVGESGCGKTTLGLSLIRALPPQGQIVDGVIEMEGMNISELSRREMKDIQWKNISIIYQGAADAFNPVKTVGYQIKEAMVNHEISVENGYDDRVADLLEMVNLGPSVANDYPHELSGGMKQRAAIAMAISCEPDLLIADEPTTALDVIVQSKVLEMLQRLQDELGFAMITISHNIATTMKLADKIGVMYAGQIIEMADPKALYDNPAHPYSLKLLNSVIDPRRPPDMVENIPGNPPDLSEPPRGCNFAPRCELATEECRECDPEMEPVDKDKTHETACHHFSEVVKND